MAWQDVVQGLGDALSGTDRAGAYRKGVAERANIDHTEAQTDAAMALARDRRLDAEKKERQKAAEDAVREQQNKLNDPDEVPGADIMSAGLGAEYSGLQAGRAHAQTTREHQTVSTPAGLGDDTAEASRQAALESLAPATTIANQRPRAAGNEPLEITIDENGNSVYTRRSDSVGQKPGARPSSGGAGVGPGGIRSTDSGLIYRQSAGLFGGTYDPTTGRFAGLDRDSAAKVQRIASRASVIFKQGNIDHATAVYQALDEMKKAAAGGGDLAPQFGNDTAPGAGAAAPVPTATGPKGEKVKYVNGQWVPVGSQ